MSLRIRRGTDAQRQTLTFDQGEVVYTTDTKKLYIGDGITAGGTNILSTSAGAGVTFNPTTQLFDFNTAALGITTSDVAEGSRKYFTSQRAQDAAAALFTATGSPTSSGSITGTIATGTIVLNSADLALVNGTRLVIAGAGGNGISAGTYYVVSSVGTSVVLANSLANATNNVPITGINTGSVTSTTYTAGGTDSGITFTYDSVNHVINVVSTGSTSLINDTNPRLGANLGLNSFNITGTGNISATGTISNGTLTASSNSITSNNISIGLGTPAISSIVNVYSPTSNAVNIYGIPGSALEFLSANGTLAVPTTLTTNDGAGGIKFSGINSNGIYQTVASIFAVYKGAANNLTDSNLKSQGILYIGVGNGTATPVSVSLDQNGEFTAPILATTVYSAAGTAIPSAVTMGVGARAFVSDATVATFATAYTSGGANKVPVYSDGTVWRIG